MAFELFLFRAIFPWEMNLFAVAALEGSNRLVFKSKRLRGCNSMIPGISAPIFTTCFHGDRRGKQVISVLEQELQGRS